jgi:hypothetical protein
MASRFLVRNDFFLISAAGTAKMTMVDAIVAEDSRPPNSPRRHTDGETSRIMAKGAIPPSKFDGAKPNAGAMSPKKVALWVAVVTVIGGVLTAAIKIIPSLMDEKKPNISVSGSRLDGSAIVSGNGNTTNINEPVLPSLKAKLDKLPSYETIVVDLSRGLKDQIRWYVEDRVEIVGPPDLKIEADFGFGLQPVEYGRDYTIKGDDVDTPITPKIKPIRPIGNGLLAIKVSVTKYNHQEAARDLNPSSRREGKE